MIVVLPELPVASACMTAALYAESELFSPERYITTFPFMG